MIRLYSKRPNRPSAVGITFYFPPPSLLPGNLYPLQQRSCIRHCSQCRFRIWDIVCHGEGWEVGASLKVDSSYRQLLECQWWLLICGSWSGNLGPYSSTIHWQNSLHLLDHSAVTAASSSGFIQLCSKLHLASCFQPCKLIASEPIMV